MWQNRFCYLVITLNTIIENTRFKCSQNYLKMYDTNFKIIKKRLRQVQKFENLSFISWIVKTYNVCNRMPTEKRDTKRIKKTRNGEPFEKRRSKLKKQTNSSTVHCCFTIFFVVKSSAGGWSVCDVDKNLAPLNAKPQSHSYSISTRNSLVYKSSFLTSTF